MKKFRAILFGILFSLSTLVVGAFGCTKITNKNATAVPVNSTLFTFASISQYGQALNLENFKTINGTTYVVANSSMTISFKPFTYFYTNITNNNLDFFAQNQTFVLEKDAETNTFPTSFEFEGTTIFVSLNNTNNSINFFKQQGDKTPYMTSAQTELINVTFWTESKVEFTVTKSYTWLEESNGEEFTFKASTSPYLTPNIYTLNFSRPTINFNNASNPILNFQTKNEDISSSDNLLQKEQEFESVKINFLSNNYSEVNPLYFNVNYNGFEYNFEVFCKTIGHEELLFVNYIDNAKTENSAMLATTLNSDGTAKNKVYKNSSNFNMLFSVTGRYEIELYDSTYVQGLKNSNYYSTSFYIKSKTSSPFENIYMIAQTYNDNGTPIEYIVSDSTQNHTVGLTIKNLTDVINNNELKDNIEIEVRKTIYGASENIPVSTFYSAEQIKNMLTPSGDLNFKFEEDADYGIIIHNKQTDKYVEYFVTLAKTAKTHYNANGNNHTATTPYHTEIIDYTYNINSNLTLTWDFGSPESTYTEKLNKNYVNKFSITYGMQQVNIVSTKVAASGEAPASIVFDFFGIGDITVEVTFNGITKQHTLNSEKGNGRLTFSDYGTYSITMVDSMGTRTSGDFEFKQPVNASTIVLIVLSSVIALVVVLFILRVRGKVKTR